MYIQIVLNLINEKRFLKKKLLSRKIVETSKKKGLKKPHSSTLELEL